ncbi:putative glycosyltransferase EpsJ [Clostridiales bacterium CHKCI001]|nr:putative glycosyltransferase EpsJ [Clostridiales bacterium CHKCI001]
MVKISVIIPAYNVESYIAVCVRSVLDQKFKDYEVILIDDGSTDRTGEICDKYAKKYEHIRVIHQKNAGLSAARNSGIAHAQGKYLCFVDSDDWVHPLYLEILYKNIILYQADIAIVCFQRFEDGNYVKVDYQISNHPIIIPKVELMSRLSQTGMREENIGVITAWNKLYKKEIFHNCNYEEGKQHEDELIIHKLIHRANRVVWSEAVLYFYRIRKNSIMDRKNRYLSDRLSIIDAFWERTRLCKKSYPEVYKDMLKGYLDTCSIQMFRMMEASQKKQQEAIRERLKKDLCKNRIDISRVDQWRYNFILHFPYAALRIFQVWQWLITKERNIARRIGGKV